MNLSHVHEQKQHNNEYQHNKGLSVLSSIQACLNVDMFLQIVENVKTIAVLMCIDDYWWVNVLWFKTT